MNLKTIIGRQAAKMFFMPWPIFRILGDVANWTSFSWVERKHPEFTLFASLDFYIDFPKYYTKLTSDNASYANVNISENQKDPFK